MTVFSTCLPADRDSKLEFRIYFFRRYTSLKIDKIINIALISFFTAFCGLGFSAFYQSKIQHDKLFARNQIIVFIKKQNTSDSPAVIKEKIINLNGINDVKLKNPDDILKDIKTLSPAVNDIMVPGDNPFSPYFIVTTSIVNQQFMQSLKDKLMTFEGVDEVKYDQNLVLLVEKLNKFILFFALVAKITAAAAVFLLAFKYFLYFRQEFFSMEELVFKVLSSFISGVMGWLLYNIFSRYLMHDTIASLPYKYILGFLTCALFLQLLEKDSQQ